MYDFKLCWALTYFSLRVTVFFSISAFGSFIGIPVSIASSAATIKICIITIGIQKNKTIIKIKRKNRDKIMLSAKAKLNAIETVISF